MRHRTFDEPNRAQVVTPSLRSQIVTSKPGRGGRRYVPIYDALHATFARRKGATRIITRNPSQFAHAAPDLESGRALKSEPDGIRATKKLLDFPPKKRKILQIAVFAANQIRPHRVAFKIEQNRTISENPKTAPLRQKHLRRRHHKSFDSPVDLRHWDFLCHWTFGIVSPFAPWRLRFHSAHGTKRNDFVETERLDLVYQALTTTTRQTVPYSDLRQK
jgi:hypothetical protein